MTLTFVEPTAVHHFSAIIYGPEGVGKSIAASSAPDPNLYLNADAVDGLRRARQVFPEKDIREVRVTGLQTLYDTILYVQEHPEIKTVTLDTVGRAYQAVLRDIARDDKHPTTPEYGDTGTHIERFVEALLELPVNVVLVSHDMTVETSGQEDDRTLRLEQLPNVGTSRPGLSRKLMQLVSIVGYCGVVQEGEDRKYVAQLFEGGGRRAKDRTGALGDIALLDLAMWAEQIGAFYAAPSTNGSSTTEEKK